MINQNKIKTLLFLSLALLFGSCEKPEGEGGRATIKGSLWIDNYNSTFTFLEAEYAGADQDVYLVYGDHTGYDDKTTTDYKGEFEFRFLRKGDYTVYVYSKDNTMRSASGDTAFVRPVKISNKKETVQLDRITIYK